jgi:hypothetical protein
VFSTPKPARPRAREIAALLRACEPRAGLAACRLDEAVATDPPFEADGLPGPLADWLAAASPEPGAVVTAEPLAGTDGLFGAAAGIYVASCCRGALLVAVPADAAAGTRPGLLERLPLGAFAVGLHLEVEAGRDRIRDLRLELQELEDLATTGEAMAGLVHALNNSLNTLTLQASVLKTRTQGHLREEVDVIHREGMQSAGRLRPLSAARVQRRQGRTAVDLNRVVREAVEGEGIAPVRIEPDLAADLPPMRINPLDLKRLLRLMLRAANTPNAGAPTALGIRTELRCGEVRLVVEPAYAPSSECGWTDALDEPEALGGALSELERLAAQSLVRLLEARLLVRPSDREGTALAMVWQLGPAAQLAAD